MLNGDLMLKALLFDMDGTLTETDRITYRGLTTACCSRYYG